MVKGESSMEKMEVRDLPLVEDNVRKWAVRIYWGGIAGLILAFLIHALLLFLVPAEPPLKTIAKETELTQSSGTEKENQQANPATSSSASTEKSATITDLIVKPIAQDPGFQLIFRYLFYILIWLLLWLLVPAGFQKITRFKLFNLEFELDRNQKEVISVIDQQMRKFKFLTYLMKEENRDILKSSFDPSHPKFRPALQYALSKMAEFYLTEWDEHISYEVLTNDEFEEKWFPAVIKKSMPLVEKYQTGVPINKENQEVAHHKNYLVYKTTQKENIYTNEEIVDYIMILSSYRTAFNENDGYLIAGITSIVSDLHQTAWSSLGVRKLREKIQLNSK